MQTARAPLPELEAGRTQQPAAPEDGTRHGGITEGRPHLLDALKDQVLLCDGGMGSRVQALTLDIDRDFWGRENCTDVLVLSRPDLVREARDAGRTVIFSSHVLSEVGQVADRVGLIRQGRLITVERVGEQLGAPA